MLDLKVKSLFFTKKLGFKINQSIIRKFFYQNNVIRV